MSKTQRTDAREKDSQKCDAKKHAYYGWKHARKLERELAEAKATFEQTVERLAKENTELRKDRRRLDWI